MKGMAALAALASASIASASFFDNFDSYATGPVSVVSSGKWMPGGGSGPDAQVVAQGRSPENALLFPTTTNPDMVAYGPTNALGYLGATATFEFAFNVHEGSLNDGGMVVAIGSGNSSTWTFDYNNELTAILIDWLSTDVGTTNVTLWDNRSGKGGWDYGTQTIAANMACDAWHTIWIQATQSVADMTANAPADADGTFVMYMDGLIRASNVPFGIDNPNGLCAMEMWTWDDDDLMDDTFLIDDVTLTPEPATSVVLALGVAALLRRRKS